MRFQTVKRIPGQDPELVVGVLEDCFRAVSSNDVVRDGRRITFFGLGPSPRAINRRDTTVIEVKAEDGGTTIDADVRFQASAFLGEAPQDVVVQQKLDRIFDSMLSHLGLDTWPDSSNGHSPHAIVESVPAVEEFQPVSEEAQKTELVENSNEAGVGEAEAHAEPLPEIEPEATTEVNAAEVVQPEIPAEAETAEVSVIEEAPAPEPAVAAQVEQGLPKAEEKEEAAPPVVEPVEALAEAKSSEEPVALLASKVLQPESALSSEKKTVEPEPAKTVTIMPRTEPRARIKFESLMAETDLEASFSKASQGASANKETPKPSMPHRFSSLEGEGTKSSGWLKGSAWVAAIVVLVVAPAAWLYLPRHSEEEAAQPQAQTQPAPIAAPQPAAAPPIAAPAPEQPGTNEDPAVVVSQWEAAMQSRDAAAQAAFYANPVERYFLRHNVSKEDVLADRRSAIERRKGVWTVKMERVRITHPKDTTARVSLIKHYMVREEGSPVSEWFVPSVLLLVRNDGRWQITSERDLGWASSMDELEE